MNWETVYYIGQTLGLLVIVATLTALALQIRQTNRLSRLETSRAIWSDGYQMFQKLFGDDDTGSLMHKALFTTETLTSEQRYRFGIILGSFISMHEIAHTMMENGQMCDGHWARMKNVLKIFANTPRFQKFWNRSRALYDPNPVFQAEIDALIAGAHFTTDNYTDYIAIITRDKSHEFNMKPWLQVM